MKVENQTPGQALEEQFGRLVEQHAPALLAYAMRRVAQPADAVDVVADTLLAAWRRLDAVPDGDRARFWLFAACRHAVGNHYRGRGRRTMLAERLRAELGPQVVPDPGASVATATAVRAAMDTLAPDDRELLRLIAWEELSPAEAAEVLGIPPGTARTRLHRARKRLRGALVAHGLHENDPPTGAAPHVAPIPSPDLEGGEHD